MCSIFFFFSSRRRHTRWTGDWSSDVCSSDLRNLTAQLSSAILLLAQLLSSQILASALRGVQMSAVQTETTTIIPAGTWIVDPVHSSIRFDVIDTDTMFKSISGRFTDFEGSVA